LRAGLLERPRLLQRLAALAAATLYAASCAPQGLLCPAIVAAASVPPVIVGWEWASGALGVLSLTALAVSLHAQVSGVLVAAASTVYVLALLESFEYVVIREFAGPAALALFSSVYVLLLYQNLPRAADLPPATREAFEEPSSRVLLSLLGALYGGLLAYYLYSPRPRIPRLAGSGSAARWLVARHRLAPLWAPLTYVLLSNPLYIALPSLLAAGIGAMLAYGRWEEPDAALLGATAGGLLILWILTPHS
jgi:hypothetical protein